MPSKELLEDREIEQLERQGKKAKRRKQIFQRGIKRDYHRQDFYQKTR